MGFGAATGAGGRSLGLAGLAALRIVLELLLAKEQLLPDGKNKVSPAIGAF